MAENKGKVYEFAPLDNYSTKEQISIRLADLAFFFAIKLLGRATRMEVEGTRNLTAIENAGKIPIYAFWHDRIFLATYFWKKRGIVVITSKSFDGEYIARFIQRFGYGAIRGSSSRSGAKALVEMIKTMRSGLPMAFTIDGPRGPRYEAKPGAILLAKKTGNPILPFIVEPRSFWTTRSWDAMQIPKPFTRAKMIIGEPIYVPDDADDSVIESKTNELQASLDELVRRGKEWRENVG